MTFVLDAKWLWPEEQTKVLVAVPGDGGGFACYAGTVVDAGPIMRIEFDSSVVVADDRGEPQIEAFVDSVYRANEDRGSGWCVDDDGEEAAAFRAATAMAGVISALYECVSCGRRVGLATPSSQQPGQGICDPAFNTPHLWKLIAL